MCPGLRGVQQNYHHTTLNGYIYLFLKNKRCWLVRPCNMNIDDKIDLVRKKNVLVPVGALNR